MHDTIHDQRLCAYADRCRGYNPTTRRAADLTGPAALCNLCLEHAERDVRALLVDWLDLAQLQAPSLSQALDTQPAGRPEPPMNYRGNPDALQREIHHTTTTWETELRAADRLADLPPLTRHGAAVQRAITIISPRLHRLAALPPTTVYPAGCEDTPTDLAGWEAIERLQHLHQRARGMLGRTTRSHWIPGDCWTCDARTADPGEGPLYRADPRDPGDDHLVWCDRCGACRPADDYHHYVTTLAWPTGAEVTV